MSVGKRMIAIDTNILIRYLTQDDLQQGNSAKQLIENDGPVFLSHIVFIETVWVLSTSYGLDRQMITKVLYEVTNCDLFTLEKSKLINKALQDYLNGYDFADMLIGYYGECNACNTTYTFDKKAAIHPVFTLLSKSLD